VKFFINFVFILIDLSKIEELMKYLIKLSLISLCFFVFQKSYSQANKIWTITNARQSTSQILQRTAYPEDFKSYSLNSALLKKMLAKAPQRSTKYSDSRVVIPFPDASGKMRNFAILKAPVMAPELANKYPDNNSYVGQNISDKSISIRFSVNQLGVYAMIFKAGKGIVYIDPIDKNRTNYMVYKRSSLPERNQSFVCLTKETSGFDTPPVSLKTFNANDAKLRTFRLALAATGEYSQFHITQAGLTNATDAEKKAAVLSAMTTTMTRVNGIFENDVALTMVLVANNDQLIYLDSITDPYTNGSGRAMLGENQSNLDTVIGSENYDIGHVFSTGGGGVANLNSPCTASKAEGVTGQSNPVGDTFDIDYVAHEMGHQFGATHTFNGDAGTCKENRTNSTAVEPGSGSTIMAYAGICSPQNVQQNSDAYFHVVSINQMFSSISTGTINCGAQSSLINNLNVPVVDAGADVVIPKSTPFRLIALGSDADNDILTYAWEQTDAEITTIPPSATATKGAVFRSVSPKLSAIRYFPDINTILSGQTANTWEVVPSVSRTLNFDVTIRDNVVGGGQTAKDAKVVTVEGNAGPFLVTSQNTSITVDIGSTQTVTWDVANTNLAPVNCTSVNILLSIDGGQTFPIILASNVPNNGSYDIVIPNNPTANARIMVAASNNVFFNVNAVDFTIQENSFALLPQNPTTEICVGSNIVLNYTYNTFGGFSETAVLSTVNLPSGINAVFSPASVSADGTNVTLTLSGISDVNLGNNDIKVTATTPSLTRTVVNKLQVYNATFATQTTQTPTDGSLGVDLSPTLSWTPNSNAKSYILQVATDINFNNIIATVNTNQTNYSLSGLAEATNYYWRVKPINACAQGSYSATAVFVTFQKTCTTTTYSAAPIAIPDNDFKGVISSISVPNNETIVEVNIGVNITHQWIGDLKLSITSPLNKTVDLIASGFCATQDMSAIFSDKGISATCNAIAPGYRGIIKPVGSLSDFNGDNAQGTWILFIADEGPNDIGSLTSWNVEVCSATSVPLSVDDQIIADFRMWPNPSDGRLNISLPNPKVEKVTIDIIDVLGRYVKHINFKETSSVFNANISLSELTKGVYSVKIIRGNKYLVRKIILY
jgi:subtilisin-like proprotein convertase family protein